MSYSCSVKTVSRARGRSATAAAAYRNAELNDARRLPPLTELQAEARRLQEEIIDLEVRGCELAAA